MQDSAQVRVDRVLTNIMLGYPTQGFVAERILPTLNVPDRTGIAFKLDESKLTLPSTSLRTGLARANRVDFNLTQVSYGPLKEHSLETPITDDVMRLYQAPLVPETTATNNVVGQLMNEKEKIVKDFVTSTSNFAAGFFATLSGTDQWSNSASALEAKINTARTKVKLGSGNYPNLAVMNPDVRDVLRMHPEVQKRLEGAVAVTNDQRDSILRDIFGVEELVIADSVVSNQIDGAFTGTKSWVYGDDVALIYRTPAPALETLSFGYLLRLDPEHATGGSAPLVGVDKWYERARKTTFVRANDYYTPWLVANTAGYLFKDVLA